MLYLFRLSSETRGQKVGARESQSNEKNGKEMTRGKIFCHVFPAPDFSPWVCSDHMKHFLLPKVAACEALHSLVLYMLGKSVTQPQGKKVRS